MGRDQEVAKDLFDDLEGKIDDCYVAGVQSYRFFRGDGVRERGAAAALEEVVEELAVHLFLGQSGACDSCFHGASRDLRFESRDRGRDHGHFSGLM